MNPNPSNLSNLKKRIIACLDVRDGSVVKGVNFEGLRRAGDPAADLVSSAADASRVTSRTARRPE